MRLTSRRWLPRSKFGGDATMLSRFRLKLLLARKCLNCAALKMDTLLFCPSLPPQKNIIKNTMKLLSSFFLLFEIWKAESLHKSGYLTITRKIRKKLLKLKKGMRLKENWLINMSATYMVDIYNNTCFVHFLAKFTSIHALIVLLHFLDFQRFVRFCSS